MKQSSLKIFLSLCLVFLIVPIITWGQNLTGVWRGTRTQTMGGCYPSYTVELHVYYSNNLNIMGNAYNFYDKEHYTKINFKGRYNPTTKRLVIIENAVLDFQIPNNCIPCIKTYDLNWQDGAIQKMTGDWKGHEMGNDNACAPGTVYLEKQSQSIFPVEILQEDSLAKIQQKLPSIQRAKEIVQTIKIHHPEIKMELFDNAEIDGDTVSVYLNNKLLIYKKPLSYKALTLQLNAFNGEDYEFLMYADNLGRIPPNTALMVITSGDNKYEIRISSSDQKSAVVKLHYQE